MNYNQRILNSVLLVSLITLGGCSSNLGGIDAGAANRMNSFELLTAAAAANSSGRAEDAAFLFFAGRARFQIDKQVFPPVETGANSPDVLKSALSLTVGQSIVPALAKDPAAFKRVVGRLVKWSPSFKDGYHPGWKYQKALDEKATASVVSATRKSILGPMQAKAKLLENEEYVKLSRIVQQAMEVERKFASIPKNDEYHKAVKKKIAAATRMKEIEWQTNPESRWHARMGWKAGEYFEDVEVIALCHAIEENNVEEMERLIADGANVKAVGKDGMTPLLWAFPENKFERFECLLKHGADANIFFESNFGVVSQPFHPYPQGGRLFEDRGCHAGQSVTHLACRSPAIEYMKSVLKYKGDPNLVDKKTGEAPLNIVLSRYTTDVRARVELLVTKGADLNRYCKYHLTFPAMQAVKRNQFATALWMLKSGADPKLYQPNGLRKLVHFVVRSERHFPSSNERIGKDYHALVAWLEQHGESLEQAREDEKLWTEKLDPRLAGSAIYEKIREEIIAKRKAKQAEQP